MQAPLGPPALVDLFYQAGISGSASLAAAAAGGSSVQWHQALVGNYNKRRNQFRNY